MLFRPQSLGLSSSVDDRQTIPEFWRVHLPVGFAVLVCALHHIVPDWTWDRLFAEGWGLIELAHFLIPLAGVVLALRAFRALPPRSSLPLRLLLAILALGLFYIAGEEHSWGQHFFGWQTPEGWAEINRQQETNLHNVSSWFNHKPRTLLNIAVLAGSVILPLAIAAGRAGWVVRRFGFVLPGRNCHPVGWLVIFYMTWDSLEKAGYLPEISPRDAEMHELYLYTWLVLYVMTLGDRIRRLSQSG